MLVLIIVVELEPDFLMGLKPVKMSRLRDVAVWLRGSEVADRAGHVTIPSRHCDHVIRP